MQVEDKWIKPVNVGTEKLGLSETQNWVKNTLYYNTRIYTLFKFADHRESLTSIYGRSQINRYLDHWSWDPVEQGTWMTCTVLTLKAKIPILDFEYIASRRERGLIPRRAQSRTRQRWAVQCMRRGRGFPDHNEERSRFQKQNLNCSQLYAHKRGDGQKNSK